MTAPAAGPLDVETVVGNQMEPVFAIDREGRMGFANDRFLAVASLAADEVVGQEYDVFDRIVEDGFDAFRRTVERVMRGDSTEERVELSMRHPEGTPVARRLPAEARVTPIHDGGTFMGVLVSLRQITKRKEHERRLRRQNERLEEFASVVSHDLRNPLNVADGHLQIASEECDTEHLDTVEAALGRMAAIIEDTLTLAKQGQYVGETEPVDLVDLVRECWSTVGTADASLVEAAPETIVADADRLRNLFENLFRNAVDHGGAGVTVRIGRLDAGFYVEDDGPGIPADDRERVFDLGYTLADGGTGFGLAIVRWVAEAHGWDATVTTGSDGGARFEFTGADVD